MAGGWKKTGQPFNCLIEDASLKMTSNTNKPNKNKK